MILRNCGGLLLLALGAIAATVEAPEGAKLKDAAKQANLDLEDPKYFFISKLTGLWQVVEVDGKPIVERRAPKGEKAIAIDYHYDKDLLFWSTYDGGIYSCPMRHRHPLNDQEVKLLYQNDEWYPVALAVDYISDLLYIIDSKVNTLHVMLLDCSSGTNLIRSFDPVAADGFKPRYLEIDPYQGELFVMDHYNTLRHIYRMNLDGTDIRPIDPEIFRGQWRMGSFTLDRQNRRILVSSPYDGYMWSLNYVGGDQQEVARVSNYASSLSLEINKNNDSYLYFVNITEYAINPEQEKVTDIMLTNVYRCNYTLDNQRCVPGSVTKMNTDEWSAVVQLKVVHPNTQKWPSEQYNPCSNSACQQLCIYSAQQSKKFTCRCKTGYRLAADGLGCEKMEEFVIFENDNYVGGMDMSAPEPGLNRSNDEVFTPFNIMIRSIGDDQFGFDYDPLRKRLMYSNNHEVIVKYLDEAIKFPTLIHPLNSFGQLAIDSTSNKFYYVNIEKDPSKGSIYSIAVSSILEEPWRVDIALRTYKKILKRNVGRVRNLAVYPSLGYVFYVSYNSLTKKWQLTRMMVDGSNATVLEDLDEVLYMAIDYDDEKMYYVDRLHSVFRTDFDFKYTAKLTTLPTKRGSLLGCDNGFSVYGDWIYVKDTNYIRRYNKTESRGKWERFDPKPFNFNMRTQLRYHSMKTKATITTPCTDKRTHGCMQICFALPDAAGKLEPHCACDDEYTPSGKMCALNTSELRVEADVQKV